LIIQEIDQSGVEMSDRLGFLNGVVKLHEFYTEQVRMLAHAYNLTNEEAATLLDGYGYHNVARAILRDPKAAEPVEEIREANG